MKRLLSLALLIAVALVAATAVTACSGPAIGGGVGGLFLLVVAALLFSLFGGTGCSDSCTGVQTCLSIEPPTDAGDVGDTDVSDADDVYLGPCLSPPPPDAGNDDTGDVDTGDTGDDDAGNDDTGVTPCLSPPPPDAGDDDAGDDDAGAHLHEPADSRDDILARMRDRLPEDVASRLDDKA